MMTPSLTLEMVQKRVNGTRMDLSGFRLEQIPMELICRCIAKGNRITWMDLSNNLLTSLPRQFCVFFPEMEVLKLRRNKLKKLPKNFGNMTSLRKLDISHNQIKRLPNSFASLEELSWLNLNHNPLDNDLAEIIGECSNDTQRESAAQNAVRYMIFSSSLGPESTAIEDHILTNDSSSSSQESDSSIDGFRQNQQEIDQTKRNRYRRESESVHHRSFCSSNSIFVIILVLVLAMGIPLWLTLDSIRGRYEDLNSSESQDQEEHRFFIQLSKVLAKQNPNSWWQFFNDFAITFKQHWIAAVNEPFVEKLNSFEFQSWIAGLVFYVKLTFRMLWHFLQPICSFFADYFVYLCRVYAVPLIQG